MTRPDAGPGNLPPDLDRLEGEIRASRARIDGTVDALRGRMARLSPRTLMERKMSHSYTSPDHGSDRDHDQYGQPARGTQYRPARSSSSMMGSVTSNPIPLALIGVGLGWLALSTSGYDRRIARSSTLRSMRHRAEDAVGYARDSLGSATGSVRNAASSAYDSAADAVSGAYDSASDAVSGAYDSASSAVGSAYDSASSAVSGAVGDASNRVANRMPNRGPSASHSTLHVRERMHDVSTGFWDMVEDHPLVAGAMGVALGAAIGAALPATQSESRWVGAYADEATERAKALAMDALDRGTRAAQAAVEAAKEEVTEAASSAADAARSAAREEARKPA